MRDFSKLIANLPFTLPFDIVPPTPLHIELEDPKVDKVRKAFQALTKQQQEEHLKSLTVEQARWYYSHPDIFLFDKQLILGEDWAFYLLRCGRGFGKSHAAAAWVAKKIRQGAMVVGLCGPKFDDVNKTMVPFILSWFLSDELENPPYLKNDQIRFKNGARIYVYSSEVETKGPNLEYLWCDEIAIWSQGQPDKIKQRFKDMSRAVRVGKRPQIIISSTPKNHPFFTDFQEKIDGYRPNYKMMQGSIFDNPHLSDDYLLGQIEESAYSPDAQQELFGDLITATPGAYWTMDIINRDRIDIPSPLIYRPKRPQLTNAQLQGQEPIPKFDPNLPYLWRILIGFDPSGGSDGDECGIVIVALYSNKEAYVLEDCSGNWNPDQYIKIISDKYKEYNASAVVVETNFGGKETWLKLLRSENALMKIIPCHNKDGKTTRAEHIANLYAHGKIHHTKIHKVLEKQMCQFNVHYSKSPDRLDALGLALTELFWPTDASGTSISIRNLPGR